MAMTTTTATRKAPAKKAAPKQVTAKPAAKADTPTKLRWTVLEGERGQKGGTEQTAPYKHGELAILRAGDAWKAVYREGKAETVLAEGSFGKAYAACVGHAKGGK
jgi:hypothetical protein